MKKIVSVLLVIAMLSAFPATAADTSSEAQKTVLSGPLSYGEVAELVSSGNINLKIARMNESLLTGNDSLNAGIDALFSASEALESAASGIDSALALFTQNPSPGTVTINTGSGQTQTINVTPSQASTAAIQAALIGSRAALKMAVTDINSQMDSMNISSSTKKQTAIRIEQAEAQLTAAAQSLYIAYIGLQSQLESIDLSSEAVARAVTEMETRFRIGQIPQLTMLSLYLQRNQLKGGRESLVNGMTDLRAEFNLMIGREYDSPLSFAPLPNADENFLSSRDFDADTKAALENNFDLRLSRLELSDMKNPKKLKSIEKQIEIKKLEISSAESRLRYLIDKQRRAIEEKKRALGLAREEYNYKNSLLTAAELKYSLGRISKNELTQTREDVTAANSAVNTADAELFTAIEAYKQIVNGLTPQS